MLREVAIAVSWSAALGVTFALFWLAVVRRRPGLLLAVAAGILLLSGFYAMSNAQRNESLQVRKAIFGDQVSLIGSRMASSGSVRPGDKVELDLFWWVPETPRVDYTVYFCTWFPWMIQEKSPSKMGHQCLATVQ